MDKSLNL